MTKHNALRMLGRSGNPTLSDATFAGFETTGAKTMSLQGTVNKVGILLALVIGGALFTWNQFYSNGSDAILMTLGLFGIGFSLFVVGIAAMNLVLDFDFIEDGAERGAPRYMEWFGAFALMVTLIWLYLEMLRLLAKIRSR